MQKRENKKQSNKKLIIFIVSVPTPRQLIILCNYLQLTNFICYHTNLKILFVFDSEY